MSIFFSVKKHTIMRRAGVSAQKYNIQKSWLLMMSLGIIINSAVIYISGHIISDVSNIKYIIDIINDTGGLFGSDIDAILVIILLGGLLGGLLGVLLSFLIGGVIGVVIDNIVGGLIGVVIGVVIGASVIGVEIYYSTKEILFYCGIILALCLAACKVNQYGKGRRDYIDKLIVADELYKVGCQQWRIFHGLKSDGGGVCIDHIVVCKKGVFCVETKTDSKRKNSNIKGEIRVESNKIYICEGNTTTTLEDVIDQVQKKVKWLHDEINKKYCKLKENEHSEINKKYCELKKNENDEIDKKYCTLKKNDPDSNKKYCELKKNENDEIDKKYCTLKKNKNDEIDKKYCKLKKNDPDSNKKYCELEEKELVVPIITFSGWCVKEVCDQTVKCNPYYKISVLPKEKGESNEIMVCNLKQISAVFEGEGDKLSNEEFNLICMFLEDATQIKLSDVV